MGLRAAKAWLRDGHAVSALTRSTENAERLSELGITPVLGDVLDPSSLTTLPAARTVLYGVGFDRRGKHSQRDVYVTGLENVLREVESRVDRVIYLSSISVYGQTGGEWVDESFPCQPDRDNGRVCLEAEQVLASLLGERATILRLAGIYGPGRLLARIAALRDNDPLAGNPTGFLNLIHVDDVVRAILACEQRGQPGTIYLVNDDHPVTRREYFETLALLLDAPAPRFDGTDSLRHTFNSLNKRCRNRRMREELLVDLAYPTIATGLRAALERE